MRAFLQMQPQLPPIAWQPRSIEIHYDRNLTQGTPFESIQMLAITRSGRVERIMRFKAV